MSDPAADLAAIRAALLQRFGPAGRGRYGFVLEDTGSTPDLLERALANLTTCLAWRRIIPPDRSIERG